MYAVLIYGFPLILLAFEWGLRFLLQVNSTGFTGPALSAAALSFLIPLTRPKILNVEIEGHPGAFATSTADSNFVGFIWVLVFATLFAWAGSCYVSMKLPNHEIIKLKTHLVIGLGTYFISLLMTFFKEKI